MTISGTCACDPPKTAHDVRRLKPCAECGDLGLDCVPTARGPMHALCALRTMPAFDIAPAAYRRARICCLLAYCDGDADKAADLYDMLQRIARAA